MAPYSRLLVTFEIQVNMIALDCPSAILDSAVTVPFDIHDSAKWVYGSIGRNCPWFCHAAAGRHSNYLALTLVRSAGEDRTKEPVALPAAAFSAFAVAGYS